MTGALLIVWAGDASVPEEFKFGSFDQGVLNAKVKSRGRKGLEGSLVACHVMCTCFLTSCHASANLSCSISSKAQQNTYRANSLGRESMADNKPSTSASAPAGNDGDGDGKDKTPAAPPPAVANPSPAPASRSSSPYVSDGSRKFSSPYTPQFSPATQMILKRMRGESGGLNSALASATAPDAPRPNFPRPVYESVRERIVASMTSGKTMSLPAPPSSSSSITASTLRLPVKPLLTSGSNGRPPVVGGQKRKRAYGEGDTSDVSSPAEGSDYGEGIKKAKPKQAATPQITQSGRRILKPDTYDPAAEDNAKKNARLGKRTTEQALCKKCTRMHSPATNQMVFCDGCNDPWHQRCHDPWIEDDIIKDQSLKWYCVICQAKRERLQPKKRVEQPRFGSWADRPASQVSSLLPDATVTCNTYMCTRNEPIFQHSLRKTWSTS